MQSSLQGLAAEICGNSDLHTLSSFSWVYGLEISLFCLREAVWNNGGDRGACANTAHRPGAPELSVSARLSFLFDWRLVRKSASPALELSSHSDLELRTQPVFGKNSL